MDRTLLERKAVAELREIASTLDLEGYQKLRKSELIDLIMGTAGNGQHANGEVQPHESSEDDSGENERTESDEDTGKDRGRADSDNSDDSDDGDDDDDSDDGGPERTRTRQRTGGGGGNTGGDGGGGGGSRGGRRNKNRRKKGGQQQGGGQQQQQQDLSDLEVRGGVLDLLPEGYGFLRTSGYLSGNKDVYVSQSLIRRHNLRRGDYAAGPIRHNKGNDKFPALVRIDTLEGTPIDEAPRDRRDFKDLTPYFPRERLHLEKSDGSPIAMRIIDMIAPVGKGQRGLIVSPPKAGKTTILKQLAQAIETNNPECHLMVLLVDERPEEVTDFERSTKGEVVSSTFDRPAEDHTQVAELTIERAKRLVERGRDVVILLDSITRLARAYNLAAPASGRILSGGVDSAALYPPKRFFGAARNIEEGGSLTIIATALVETGSKMDEVIFEEFKGTGNMELRLSRSLEQKRIFPAVDIEASGTRKEELLLEPDELEAVWKLRRVLHSMDGGASLELLIDKLRATKSNGQFLQLIQKSSLS
jgi:transcription termination factor Rho